MERDMIYRESQGARAATGHTTDPVIGSDGGELGDRTNSAIKRAQGGGRPLEEPLRRSMEGAFGADFSSVRVHADNEADSLNSKIQARAFTTGSDVFFGAGEYTPSTSAGQSLIAHELAHVVQQQPGRIRRFERSAERGSRDETHLGDSELDGTWSRRSTRVQRRAVGGDDVIRRWSTSTLEQTKKSELLEKMIASNTLMQGMLLSNLASRTKDVDELDKLLAKTDSDTLNKILSGLDPSPGGDNTSFVYGSWALLGISKFSAPTYLQLVQLAQDPRAKAAKAKALWGVVSRLSEVDAVTVVSVTGSATMANELLGCLTGRQEVAKLVDFLEVASPTSVLAALKLRKKGEDLDTVRPNVVASGATDNSVTDGNGTVIKYYRVDDLPIPAEDITYAKRALEVFDGKAGVDNTWRGQRNAPHDNRKADLPGVKNAGGYLEHDVESPGEGGAGTRRLVTDENSNAVYYTNTHYGQTGSPAFYLIRKA